MTYDSILDDPQSWPSRDPAGYVFLARAVHAVGKAVFGDEWTGDEAPAPQARRRDLPGYVLSISDKMGMARFEKVQDTIATAAETGTLVTAAREVGGGRIIPLSAADWSTEHLARRFSTCRIDPRDPFGHLGSFLTHWIYLDAKSLEQLIKPITSKSTSNSGARKKAAIEFLKPLLTKPRPADMNKNILKRQCMDATNVGTRGFLAAWESVNAHSSWVTSGRPKSKQ